MSVAVTLVTGVYNYKEARDIHLQAGLYLEVQMMSLDLSALLSSLLTVFSDRVYQNVTKRLPTVPNILAIVYITFTVAAAAKALCFINLPWGHVPKCAPITEIECPDWLGVRHEPILRAGG